MIVATGLFSAPADRLAMLIADTETWRNLRGVDNRDDALKSIHVPLAVDNPEDAFRNDETGVDEAVAIYPRCEISNAGQQATRRKIGWNNWTTNGNLMLTVEIPIPEEYAITEYLQWKWFGNKIGDLICEIQAMAANGESVPGETHLNVVEISIEDSGHEPPEAQRHETVGDDDIYVGPRAELWWATLLLEYF